MKIAVSCNGNQIWAHFGHCENFMIYEAGKRCHHLRAVGSKSGTSTGLFAKLLADMGVAVIISGGIDVSFPAVGCVAMYVPLYMNYHEMGPDNLFFFFGLAMFIGLVFGS